jgi:hypothetical protein
MPEPSSSWPPNPGDLVFILSVDDHNGEGGLHWGMIHPEEPPFAAEDPRTGGIVAGRFYGVTEKAFKAFGFDIGKVFTAIKVIFTTGEGPFRLEGIAWTDAETERFGKLGGQPGLQNPYFAPPALQYTSYGQRRNPYFAPPALQYTSYGQRTNPPLWQDQPLTPDPAHHINFGDAPGGDPAWLKQMRPMIKYAVRQADPKLLAHYIKDDPQLQRVARGDIRPEVEDERMTVAWLYDRLVDDRGVPRKYGIALNPQRNPSCQDDDKCRADLNKVMFGIVFDPDELHPVARREWERQRREAYVPAYQNPVELPPGQALYNTKTGGIAWQKNPTKRDRERERRLKLEAEQAELFEAPLFPVFDFGPPPSELKWWVYDHQKVLLGVIEARSWQRAQKAAKKRWKKKVWEVWASDMEEYLGELRRKGLSYDFATHKVRWDRQNPCYSDEWVQQHKRSYGAY